MVPACTAPEEQREAIHRRLREEAESQGVDGRRIVWAKWVSKWEHLLRHALADLFLDTLTYGAHSTATDALAGGLPLLTLAGATASRGAQRGVDCRGHGLIFDRVR